MEKKIKSVKLKQDIRTPESFIPKGTNGKITKYADYLGGELCKFTNCVTDAIYQCKIRDAEDLPDWFEIEYEQEYFEVKPPLDENMFDKADIVLHYFAKLAEYLNGLKGWKYKIDSHYRTLHFLDNGNRLILDFWTVCRFPVTKFSPDLTIDDIKTHAKPEMIEAYIEICKNQIY